MCRILWLTDIHLDHLRNWNAAQTFGAYLRIEHWFDIVVITGDIAEANSVSQILNNFSIGVAPKKVFFVLGNHDYYQGSFADVQKDIIKNLGSNLVWLDSSSPVLLDNNVALIGHQGWFDGLLGDAKGSDVILSDFVLIKDLKILYNPVFWGVVGGRDRFLKKVQELGEQSANEARLKLLQALRLRKTVVFATHFPPFKEACWHEGSVSNSNWLPWFTCKAMGEMLLEVASEHPKNQILVLCGHTHSSGAYQALGNLRVLTGKAIYGAPDISGIFTLPLFDDLKDLMI